MKKLICVATFFCLATPVLARAKVVTKMVEYKQGDTVLEGILAYDDKVKTKRPGVLIVHDWMGVGDYVKMRAEQVAKLGYVAFAADIYGKNNRPKDQKQAAEIAGSFRKDRPLLRDRAKAGLETLLKSNLVDAKRVATMGYCFGGGTSLELARSGADLRGAISFHGNLDTPNADDAKNIKAKVLVLHGADDPYVPSEQVQAFQTEMRNAKIDWQFVAYGNAVHAFTEQHAGNDNSKGAAYNADADKRSWIAMKDFFGEIFNSK